MRKSIIMAIAIGLTMLLSSCHRKGCTDSNATNYCTKCKKDDGTCTYQAKGNFWYDQTTSDSLIANGITSLTFYFDGSVIGSSGSNVYFSGSPSCGQSGSPSVTKNFSGSPSKSYSYAVKDQNGNTIWSGSANLSASNSCLSTQLTW